MVKTRGLKEAKEKLGDIEEIIKNKLRKNKKISIFESGCGYGKVIIELKKIFGNRIETVGMNLIPEHGNKKKILSFAIEEGIVLKEDLKKIKPIKIIFGDAGERLPLKTNSIDFIYSQTSTYLYKDKLHFFEEVSRVLKKNGIARITLPESKAVPKEFQPLLRIFKEGKEIGLAKMISNKKLIKLVKTPSGKALEIRGGNLEFDAKLEASINLNSLNKKLFGVQSIYVLR
jgi:ubiquinone/menaquinone biosynthesis C-methylase UbiE